MLLVKNVENILILQQELCLSSIIWRYLFSENEAFAFSTQTDILFSEKRWCRTIQHIFDLRNIAKYDCREAPVHFIVDMSIQLLRIVVLL